MDILINGTVSFSKTQNHLYIDIHNPPNNDPIAFKKNNDVMNWSAGDPEFVKKYLEHRRNLRMSRNLV